MYICGIHGLQYNKYRLCLKTVLTSMVYAREFCPMRHNRIQYMGHNPVSIFYAYVTLA